MNAQQILEQKGIDSNEAASIVYEELDIKVRELYNVLNHPIHLWDKYCIGDAIEEDVLKDAESNTTPIKKYDDIDNLFWDMTQELERLASIYQKVSIQTYKQAEGDLFSVYLLSNEELWRDEALDLLEDNYEYSELCELVDEDDQSVAQEYGYKHCAVFHKKPADTKTYDVHFNDSTDSNSKGFKKTLQYCKDYIEANNGTKESYFEDYKGGTVSVVCNETGEEVYSEKIK